MEAAEEALREQVVPARGQRRDVRRPTVEAAAGRR